MMIWLWRSPGRCRLEVAAFPDLVVVALSQFGIQRMQIIHDHPN